MSKCDECVRFVITECALLRHAMDMHIILDRSGDHERRKRQIVEWQSVIANIQAATAKCLHTDDDGDDKAGAKGKPSETPLRLSLATATVTTLGEDSKQVCVGQTEEV